MNKGGRMRYWGQCHGRYIVVIVVILVFAAFTAVQGKAEGKSGLLSLADVDVKGCEGVVVTQCELAKNIILTLKMGEDLTCEACFVSLGALGIAPGEDWSYDDPHKVVTPDEIKEVVLEIHRAYNEGTVRLDGFETAAAINRFCQDIKGPTAPPPTGTEEKPKGEGGQQEEKPVPATIPTPGTQEEGK
jgi:hypothetical protein